MDNFRNTYGLAIGNDEPSLAATAVKLLQEKKNTINPPLSISTFLNDILPLSLP